MMAKEARREAQYEEKMQIQKESKRAKNIKENRKAYLEIARRILGENIDVTIPGRDEGFFTKIKGIFRKK